MTKLEQAARQALEVLEHIQKCIGFGTATIHFDSATWHQSEDSITALQEALDAAPAASNHEAFKLGYAKGVDDAERRANARGEQPATVEQAPVAWTANEWSVFNSGAEVASGLSLDEAMDYLTDERAARGWSVVCVINKDNMPTPTAPQPTRQPLTDEQVWKSEEIMAVNAAVGLVMDDLMMLVRAVERTIEIGGEV